MTVSFVYRKLISSAALFLFLLAILLSSGCTGLTGAPNSSSQNPTPGSSTLSVAPDAIKFGSVGLGGTLSQSVTVTNHGTSNVTITKASTTAAGVTVTGISLPLTIAAGKQVTFNVVFSPKTPGPLSGNVSVVSDVSANAKHNRTEWYRPCCIRFSHHEHHQLELWKRGDWKEQRIERRTHEFGKFQCDRVQGNRCGGAIFG